MKMNQLPRGCVAALEQLKKFCGHLKLSSESGLFEFWPRFGSVAGHCGHAPSPKPCQNSKILTSNGHGISLIALGIFFCLTLAARADDEADRAALRSIRTNYMEAVNSGDLSKIAPHLSKEVTGVMVTGEEVKGFEGLESYWKRIQDLIGPGGSYHQTVNADRTDLYNDVAVSRGNTEDVVRLGNGKELHFNSYWTAVCRKEGSAWKVIRMEATMDPVDNVFVSARLQKTKLVYGIGGIVAGVIVARAIRFLRSGARGNLAKP